MHQISITIRDLARDPSDHRRTAMYFGPKPGPPSHHLLFFSAETLPSENGVSAEQHFSEEPMDTSSAPPRPPAPRSTTEHRSPAGNSPHYSPQQPPLRRVTSNPSDLATTRMLRRVEGTLCKGAWIYKPLLLRLRDVSSSSCVAFYCLWFGIIYIFLVE